MNKQTNSFNYFLPKQGPILSSRNGGGSSRGGRGEVARYVGKVGETGEAGEAGRTG